MSFFIWQREKDSNGVPPFEANHDVPTRSPLTRQPLGDDIVRVRIPPTRTLKKKSSQPKLRAFWQREKDSNPHIRSQSPLCYHYTIPLCS